MKNRIRFLLFDMLLLIIGIINVNAESVDYYLNITDDNIFKEKIVYQLIKYDNYFDSVISDDKILAFSNKSEYYNKISNNDGRNYIIELTYNFKEDDFKDSYQLNKCFDNVSFGNNGQYYIFDGSGYFSCYRYQMSINVTTNKQVIFNNADSVNGNTYTWNINEDNYFNFKMKMKLVRDSNYNSQSSDDLTNNSNNKLINQILIIVLSIFAVFAIIVLYFLYRNKKNNKI